MEKKLKQMKHLDEQTKSLLTGKVKSLKDVKIYTSSDKVSIKYDVEIEGEITKYKLNPNALTDMLDGKISKEEFDYHIMITSSPESLTMANADRIHGLLIDDVVYKLNGKIIVSNFRINDIKVKGDVFNEIQKKIEAELNEYYIKKRELWFM